MKIIKKKLANLTKCYSITPLRYNQQDCFLVAAEKADRCILFDADGNEMDTIWSEPGGTMCMVQVPDTNGQFLATHQFYSPNDSKEAKIVLVTPKATGHWKVKTLVSLPHVHRFDILHRNGVNYLFACTLKSGHQYKDDWSSPGKVYATMLPRDLTLLDKLEMRVIKDNLLKNHGYCRITKDDFDAAIVSSENGVFEFTPPATGTDDWEIRTLLQEATSDAMMIDIDRDGELELLTIAPFHGKNIYIYKKRYNEYKRIYHHKERAEFAHAISGGIICGQPMAIVGHRQGEKNLILFHHDKERQEIVSQIIDKACGPANVYHYVRNGKDIIIAANREIDEVAMYTITST